MKGEALMGTKEASPVATRPLRPLWFSLLAVVVGVVAGLGAVVFRGLIGLFHNLLFLGRWSLVYDANQHSPASPWGPLVILVPVVGAVGVAFLVKTFAPEAKGHGVPEVMDAIYYNRGRIRPLVALIKALASALSIGSGGSVGREGPIIQIGSSFGSSIGQLLRVPAWQRIALISGGAGGGIAATFNTPIGGVLFCLEIMMHEVSVRTLVPVAISVATATYVGRLFFGPHPSFVIPALETPFFHVTNPLLLLAYAGLGVVMGGVSALFIKSIYGFEDFFEKRIKGSYYRQHLLGMFGVGLILYGLMSACGHYYVEGVGYATVQDVLSGAKLSLALLLVLFVMKLLATSLTLGSGASGGIFSPSLFLGATLGGAYGMMLRGLFPHLDISPPAFAIVGMAGVVGGATGAAMAAIVMIFEMTLDYNVIVPMTITVAISYGVRRVLSRESIYTMKLARRGHYIPDALRTSPRFVRRASEMEVPSFGPLPASTTLLEFAKIVTQQPSVLVFLVEDRDQIIGYVRNEAALKVLGDGSSSLTLGQVAQSNYITVSGQTSLFDVISRMHASDASIALVSSGTGRVSAGQVKGLISRRQLADALVEAAELFQD
jgi:chloride channel protein, CIC family